MVVNILFCMMQIMLQFLKDQHIDRLQLKQLPSIYCDFPSDEMEQLCFLLKAHLVKREALAIVDFSHKMEVSRVRKRGVERGKQLGLVIKEVYNFEEFWCFGSKFTYSYLWSSCDFYCAFGTKGNFRNRPSSFQPHL
jgi:hypothetical protein